MLKDFSSSSRDRPNETENKEGEDEDSAAEDAEAAEVSELDEGKKSTGISRFQKTSLTSIF